MIDKERITGIKKALRDIISYPKKGDPGGTEDGFPLEIVYNKFAYKRMVISYRDGLRRVLHDYRL